MTVHRVAALVLIGILLAGALRPPPSAAAQQELEPQVKYVFGERLTFEVNFSLEALPAQVVVFFKVEGESGERSQAAMLDDLGTAVAVYELQSHPIRVFTLVDYWFVITPQAGEPYSSGRFTFFYNDNRFEWQSLAQGDFHVYWYGAQVDFGQAVADIALQGAARIQSLLPDMVPAPAPTAIYVYASARELQSTRQWAGIDWVAGHADPHLGLMLVSLPDGLDREWEMARQIPHELAHITLYRAMGEGYRNLPTWLNEGLASIAELNPNPDYDVILNRAYEKRALLPLDTLCQNFPLDASGAFLAYAESFAFVTYLYQHFEARGVQALISGYAGGMTCQAGVEAALGQTLASLEADWRRERFGENIVGSALRAMLPWGILLGLAVGIPLLAAAITLRSPTRTRKRFVGNGANKTAASRG